MTLLKSKGGGGGVGWVGGEGGGGGGGGVSGGGGGGVGGGGKQTIIAQGYTSGFSRSIGDQNRGCLRNTRVTRYMCLMTCCILSQILAVIDGDYLPSQAIYCR